MAYLGNSPARSFISFERQVFTIVNSQTVYTLDHSVTNENDIRLVVNNIVQEPGSGKAYTATGTTLTLSAALVNGTDEMYCVFLGRATATNAPGAGSVGTAQLAADSVTNAKIADDAISDAQLDPTVITGQTAETSIATDDLILLSDTSASGALRKMTRANFVSGVGGTMTPAFQANLSSNQSVTNNTYTKIQCNTEIFDTNSAYDNSTNYRFTIPSYEAGRYFIYGNIGIYGNTTTDVKNAYLSIYKNGTLLHENRNDIGSTPYETQIPITIASILDLSVSDYVELYGIVNTNSGSNGLFLGDSTSNKTFFGAYKIIE